MLSRIIFEFLFILFMTVSMVALYNYHPKAPLWAMISMSLGIFYYLVLAFYNIFLGMIGKTNAAGVVSVFVYFSLSFIITGTVASVFLMPVARIIVFIGLIPAVVCLIVITFNRVEYVAVSGKYYINLMLARLILFSLISFFILRTSSYDFYKQFGPLKRDSQTFKLLDQCLEGENDCEEFYKYQRQKMSERWN